MDFALKQIDVVLQQKGYQVSILVLMDFALKLDETGRLQTVWDGFNPCFDGFCSKTAIRTSAFVTFATGFNPCFDGFCSKTVLFSSSPLLPAWVSILVLMDFALKLK